MPALRSEGLTLLELLIVTAIVALLALIAIPNWLEAQTRAKVSRVRADFAAAATAIEAYTVDYGAPPMNDGVFNNLPLELTTPVAYLHDNYLIDPFKIHDVNPIYGHLAKYYTYTEIVDLETMWARIAMGRVPPLEAVDAPPYNPGAFRKYGRWRMVSDGPDRSYVLPGHAPGDDPLDPLDRLMGIDVPYDPTNGTVSKGNLMRTQRAAVPSFPLY